MVDTVGCANCPSVWVEYDDGLCYSCHWDQRMRDEPREPFDNGNE